MELFCEQSNLAGLARESAELVITVVPAVMRAFRKEMRAGRPSELTIPQFRALIQLQCHPGISISTIAEHLGLALSTASQMIDGLLKRGYVTREVAAGDRRRAIVTLTASGQQMLDTVRAHAIAQMEERFGQLTVAEHQALNIAMGALARAFRTTPGTGD